MSEDDRVTIEDVGNLMSDLRGIAIGLLANERNAASLAPSDLVQTALRRYKVSTQDWSEIRWETRAHFFKCASMMMRRALADHARKRNAHKRPKIDYKPPEEISPHNLLETLDNAPDVILALDEALAWLADYDTELSDIVQNHYFFGSSIADLQKLLGCAERTVKRRLRLARSLLKNRIDKILNGKLEGE